MGLVLLIYLLIHLLVHLLVYELLTCYLLCDYSRCQWVLLFILRKLPQNLQTLWMTVASSPGHSAVFLLLSEFVGAEAVSDPPCC